MILVSVLIYECADTWQDIRLVYNRKEGRNRDGRTVKGRNIMIFTRRRGAHTAHTQLGRPTHEAPTREYTHKHTHKHIAHVLQYLSYRILL